MNQTGQLRWALNNVVGLRTPPCDPLLDLLHAWVVEKFFGRCVLPDLHSMLPTAALPCPALPCPAAYGCSLPQRDVFQHLEPGSPLSASLVCLGA